MESLTEDNLVCQKIARTAVSSPFIRMVKRARFPYDLGDGSAAASKGLGTHRKGPTMGLREAAGR